MSDRDPETLFTTTFSTEDQSRDLAFRFPPGMKNITVTVTIDDPPGRGARARRRAKARQIGSAIDFFDESGVAR